MSKNSPAAKARKAENKAFYVDFLEGFAGQYDIDIEAFGDAKIHWRLTDGNAMIDIWPTTGKFYIKELPIGRGIATTERGGTLPLDYTKLDKFLRSLFAC